MNVIAQILILIHVYLRVYRSSIASPTTWHWSSSSPPKYRREEEEEEVEESRRSSFHFPRARSFAFALPQLLCPLCGSGHSVAPVLHPLQMAKLALSRKCAEEECSRGGDVYSCMLIVQLFECQRAPVCFGPPFKCNASHHSPPTLRSHGPDASCCCSCSTPCAL